MEKYKRLRYMFRKLILTLDCKIDTEYLGSQYGGFTIAKCKKDYLRVYSFGVGEEISFDKAILSRGGEVYAFDPTPKSINWIEAQDMPKNFHFFPYGLLDRNCLEKFYLPKNKAHVSGSIVRHELTHSEIEVPMKNIVTIMMEQRHKYIDVLKMDIEGSEFKVIKNIMKEKIRVNQICVEVHDRFYKDGLKKLINMRFMLRREGYFLVAVSATGEELTFVKKRVRKKSSI